MKYLYHITLKENLLNILNYGLIPNIGTQCKKCRNDHPREKLVYMITIDNINSWKSSLYHDRKDCIIIQVDCTNLKLIYRNKFKEGIEYASREIIPVKNLKIWEPYTFH